MEDKQKYYLPLEETAVGTPTLFQCPLATTKFTVPVASHPLIPRPRLNKLLDESFKYPLTLVSAPAGFGKTTLLAAWGKSLPQDKYRLCWTSLDSGDSEPRTFWTCVLSALNKQCPERFTPLINYLQSSQNQPLRCVLKTLINIVVELKKTFILVLDNYHMIKDDEIHNALIYLIGHVGQKLHMILSTRSNPPLPLPLLQSRQQVLIISMNQLRCTDDECRTFLRKMMSINISDEMILQISSRTEGWLVGMQLLGLSLSEHTDPLSLQEEISGEQRYILDYLTEEVLLQQPQDMQMFLLSTSILENLTAPLCDAVMRQNSSQKMLEQLECNNVFITSLDNKRQNYRYHALFAEALRHQLEYMYSDLVPALHDRASFWYAQHGYTFEAIFHACNARQWERAADLIERLPLILLSEHQTRILRQCLMQLPTDLLHSRPRLCLASAQILWAVTTQTTLETWLSTAETLLSASLPVQTNQDTGQPILNPKERQERKNLLGELIAFRALMESHQEEGEKALSRCQQALTLLSAENFVARTQVSLAQLRACYVSSANDAASAIQSGLQAGSLAQLAGQSTFATIIMGTTAMYMIGAGRLNEARQLSQQATLLASRKGARLPEAGCPALFQAEILREWNQLDSSLSLAQEAIVLCKQSRSVVPMPLLLWGYAVLMRIFLSRQDWCAAQMALREVERIGIGMNQVLSLHARSLFTTVDQVRLWLACGELDRAVQWTERLRIQGHKGAPFAHEREEVAHARILLAMKQPDLALKRLEPVLAKAMMAQRWGHVIEVHLLQALAHQMLHEETLALSVLSEALHLAEPEGYIRSFVDEGAPMAALLSQLRQEQYAAGPTPYLDTLLAAFPQENATHEPQSRQAKSCARICEDKNGRGNSQYQPRPKRNTERTMTQLLDPLSEREREVLHLLAQGASNQEIGQKLMIATDTVKRHVSHIISKLDVKNRLQAVRQAQVLNLLDEER
jgi:LuxR family maltose regulon positive regulatory protein